MNDDARTTPVTDEQRRRAEQALAKLKRDLAEADRRPPPPATSPGKFTGRVGVDDRGDLQPPPTPEQNAHLEEIRRRARRELSQPSPPSRPPE